MKKIFTSEQIRQADAYTINNEPISSVDLMERASEACYNWITKNIPQSKNITIVCGCGNNGGDGLALARMLSKLGDKNITLFVLKISPNPSHDFCVNYERLKPIQQIDIVELNPQESIKIPHNTDLLIDAIFGTGLNRPLKDWVENIVQSMNNFSTAIHLAIDVPSGLFVDATSKENTIFRTDICLTFEYPKLPFLFPENEKFIGNFYVLPIGLHPDYTKKTPTELFFVDTEDSVVLPRRRKFSHKGDFGHALIVAGSYGKMGAAILANKACLRTGAGLVTAHIPTFGVDCMQTACPEIMVSIDIGTKVISSIPNNTDKYTVAAVGPGIGTDITTQKALENFLKLWDKPLVLDADALNCISMNKDLLKLLPQNTIITPHPKEFERLVGTWNNDFERLQKQRDLSSKYGIIVLLKGANTSISLPDGKVYFNTTGNPCMATAGSGDVLTGIITGLLSQKVAPQQSAIAGAFIHGLAGDSAAKTKGISLIASDIIDNITIVTK